MLIGSLAILPINPTEAIPSSMTFTTGETLSFTSSTEIQFWSNVTMKFGTGIKIQFIELANGNGIMEPCDIIQLMPPITFQPYPCSWWEVLGPGGVPLGEIHFDGQQGPSEFHIDMVYPGSFPLIPIGGVNVAELKIERIETCQYYVVHWPVGWYPPECSWWEIMDPETGHATGIEIHVDWTNQSCEFHIDEVIPGPVIFPWPWVWELTARRKIVEITPCDWFVLIDGSPKPTACTWWEIMYQGQPMGLEFHVDQSPAGNAFHVDMINPSPLRIPPTYPTVARKKINVIAACEWFQVGDPSLTPKACTWWKIISPDIGDVEFHVDQAYPSNGTFHIDQTIPPTTTLNPPVPVVTAEKKFVGLGPCDWFKVAAPQGYIPTPCTWWRITSPAQWAGVKFHTDSNDGISKFHIDIADALPPGPTPPPYSVTAEPAQPPTGPWYVKPAYPDYAPSGMPDFDEKQDQWGPGPGIYTWCGPVAAANSLWWFDSKWESLYGTESNLVPSYGAWDDHDPQNLDSFVRNLAFFFDTDDLALPHDGHTGTRWQDMESGLKQYIMQAGLAGFYEVHNKTYPYFEWIEDEIERCQDVVLFLEFYQWTGSSWQKLYDNPSLEQGHCVTCAGVNSTSNELLISDPWWDAYESGINPKGRSPVWHPYPHPAQVHNDTQFVSHDAYLVANFSVLPPPPGYPMQTRELVNYLQYLGYPASYHAFITAAVVTSPLGVHDVAVTNVKPLKNFIGQGYRGRINVTVTNQGDFTETFDLTLSAGTMPPTTTMRTVTVSNLLAGETRTITMAWNTSQPSLWAKANYTIIMAYANLPGDADPADNTCTDGWIFVSIPGDTAAEYRLVDIFDVVKITGIYEYYPTDPGYDPNSDIDDNDFVDIFDVVACTSHYDESW
jgi:hypothetical protein